MQQRPVPVNTSLECNPATKGSIKLAEVVRTGQGGLSGTSLSPHRRESTVSKVV
jgi:hypothetical protein